MKRQITLSLAVLLMFPVIAAAGSAQRFKSGSEAKVRSMPGNPGGLAKLMAQSRAARAGVGATLVADARSSDVLVFPAAGNVRGAGGEFFRSDVTMVSYDDVDQDLAVYWLQNGVATNDPPYKVITLDANTYYTFTDFVGVTLERQQQLGTIVVFPIDAAGNYDLDAALDGFSRIWTNQPNATGTVAQPFEPVDPYVFAAVPAASIMGLRHEGGFRTNVGIVNMDDESPHTFQVTFLGERGQATDTITLPPLGMTHRGIPAGDYGALVIEVEIDDENAPWVAYGTSQDNTTGDGWVSIGSMILTPEDLVN